MNTFGRWALILAVPAVCVAAALPGEERLVPGGTTVQLLLLRQKAVRHDLKVTPEEREKIFEFTYNQYQAAEQALKLGAAERKQKFEQLHKQNEKFLAETLKPEQRKRLDQITMQVAGLLWLERPAVARELQLTSEQQQKAKELREEARKEVKELINAKSPEGRHEKFAELRKTTRQRITALLTPDQRTKWKTMAGTAFKGEIRFEEPEKEKGK